VLRDALGAEDPVVAHALSGLGQVLQDRGDVDGGVACQERALQALIAAYGPEHPDVGHVYGKLGFALGLQRDFARARTCQQESLRILTETFGEGHLETGWPLSNLGVLCLDAGDVDEAVALQERALVVFRSTPEGGLPEWIAAWRLARALRPAGRHDEAIQLLQNVVPALTETLGTGHADVAAASADLAAARQVGRATPVTQLAVGAP
jgi:tetratricopeptide (TPR) repeat protein